MNAKDLKKFLANKIVPTKRSVMIWGPVGVGKSSAVAQFCEENGYKMIDIRLSQMDPVDLRGVPVVDGALKRASWCLPDVFPKEDEKVVMFFDEINLASPSVQAAAYQIILDRCLGNWKAGKDTLIIAAGNRVQDNTGVQEMPKALSNRLVHVDFESPSVNEWGEYMASKPHFDSRVLAYLNWQKNSLFDFKPDSEDRAFPTPRSWEFCCQMIKGETSKRVIQEMAEGVIGKGRAMELSSFIDLCMSYNVEEILKKPVKEEIPTDAQHAYAFTSAVIDYVKTKEGSKYRPAAYKISTMMDSDFGMLLYKNLLLSDSRSGILSSSKRSPEEVEATDKFGKLMRVFHK